MVCGPSPALANPPRDKLGEGYQEPDPEWIGARLGETCSDPYGIGAPEWGWCFGFAQARSAGTSPHFSPSTDSRRGRVAEGREGAIRILAEDSGAAGPIQTSGERARLGYRPAEFGFPLPPRWGTLPQIGDFGAGVD